MHKDAYNYSQFDVIQYYRLLSIYFQVDVFLCHIIKGPIIVHRQHIPEMQCKQFNRFVSSNTTLQQKNHYNWFVLLLRFVNIRHIWLHILRLLAYVHAFAFCFVRKIPTHTKPIYQWLYERTFDIIIFLPYALVDRYFWWSMCLFIIQTKRVNIKTKTMQYNARVCKHIMLSAFS